MWAKDIDHRAVEGAPDDHGPIIGRDAMRAYAADWYEMFPDLTISFEDITDAGPGRVIAVSHLAGTARASGVPTELRCPVGRRGGPALTPARCPRPLRRRQR